GCGGGGRVVGWVAASPPARAGQTPPNDRLVGVAADSRLLTRVRTLEALGPDLLEEIEHFFVSYNQIKGKVFNPLGRFGPQRALEIVEEGMTRFRRSKRKRAPAKPGKAKKRK
ncbi:MAG: inorganic diphosphatase, partial [Pyrinomonadaceae bacterium]